MNLKSRLFKKSWQNKDPEVRAQAVNESDDPELKSELARLAQHDESAVVRLAALKRINTEHFWLDARLRETDDAIIAAADGFLAREVPRNASPGLEAERLQWFGKTDSADLTRRMARQAADINLRRAALERINAQGFLGDCFGSEADEELAVEILERIDQESTLERLAESLRKTSKKRAQAAADRLTSLRQASGKSGPDQRTATELVRRAEALARGQGDSDRGEALEELIRQWSLVIEPTETLERRFEGAASIVRASLDRPARAASPEPPEEESTPTAANSVLEKVATHIRNTIRQARKEIKPGELLGDWDRAWNELGQANEADLALKEEMLPLLRELQVQAEQKASKKSKQKPEEKSPEAERAATDNTAAELDARLDTIAQCLEDGDIGKSHDLIRALRTDFDRLPTRARPRPVGGRLQRMEGRLKEMRNWQHWSNNKHRDELIDQIEKLPGSGQHPDAVSVALKEARDEWKRLEKLEVLPGDRKRFAAPPGQWRRFQAACKQAFETARPYFEKRQEVQDTNLEQLQKFIEAGMSLANADEPDSKLLQQTMRAARQAIRRMDDLPPRDRGKSASGLRALMDAISKRLDEVFEQIELTKRRLITEARALAQETDLKAAADKAKALQAQWQKAGTGRRKVEQKLWEEFREPIDPLFDQLKGERQEQKQADKEAVAELKALCLEAENLVKVNDDELETARGRMTALAEDWFGRPGRPAALNARFEKSEAEFARRLDQLRNKARDQARLQLETLTESIQTLWEKRLRQGNSVGLEDLLPSDGSTADSELGKHLHATAARLTNAETSQAELVEQVLKNTGEARQIAVEIEFLAGIETPASDRKLRMDYQVRRLAQRMSERGAQPDLKTELASLQKRWTMSLPHDPDQHAELAARFIKSRDMVRKMTGH